MWSIGFQGAKPDYPDKAARPVIPLTALGLLENAHQLGNALVQTGPNLGFDRLCFTEQEEFVRKAGEMGIELELGPRELDYDHIVQQVSLARRMGAKLIRTLPEIGGKYTTEAGLIPRAIAPSYRSLSGRGSS